MISMVVFIFGLDVDLNRRGCFYLLMYTSDVARNLYMCVWGGGVRVGVGVCVWGWVCVCVYIYELNWDCITKKILTCSFCPLPRFPAVPSYSCRHSHNCGKAQQDSFFPQQLLSGQPIKLSDWALGCSDFYLFLNINIVHAFVDRDWNP
jgi:hypothetical protein